ncbi:PA2169 family four-helix-bundle protein [uncultured Salegentibacter sp.]|uniref:ferritin-like domain-containing protein n=1 Tax=uncultured Salegentibacter sp. TaxID=259320 RepID=UPI002594203E|nr:PA2169 family four-helix-bundle protein [uncultured Salegentibacter sp.]
MNYSEKVAGELNTLLKKNKDAEKGYQYAAENAQDPQLKAFFSERAQERYDFGHELETEIRDFGENPERGSSLAGEAHRTWMNLKSSLSSNKDEAALEEAVRGEQVAADEYEEVLKNPEIPPTTANLLLKQKNGIVAALNKLKGIKLQA